MPDDDLDRLEARYDYALPSEQVAAIQERLAIESFTCQQIARYYGPNFPPEAIWLGAYEVATNRHVLTVDVLREWFATLEGSDA